MTLTNINEMPPRGYLYREPSINWDMPGDVAVQGMKAAALALQQARANNPAAKLDTSYKACVRAISEYTCKRLEGTHRDYFCGGSETTPQERAAAAARRERVENPRRCASCGGRR